MKGKFNLKHKTQNTKHEHKTQNTKHQMQNTKSKTQPAVTRAGGSPNMQHYASGQSAAGMRNFKYQ